jgi:hypothetical protein
VNYYFRAGSDRTGQRRLRILVVDCHESEMARAQRALRAAGHESYGARDLAAASVLVDSADVVVLDPGPGEQILRDLAPALRFDGTLILYSDHHERLCRSGRPVITVAKGDLAALLDAVAGARLHLSF